MFDIYLMGFSMLFLVGILLALFAPNAFDGSMTPGESLLWGIGAVALATIPLAVLVGIWGTTLGKWLFGIRVSDSSGRPIGFSAALSREWKAFVMGMGFGIPIVAFFTLISSYSRLTKQGSTSWDEEGNFVISHSQLGVGSVLKIAAGALMLLTMMILVAAIGRME